MILVIYLTLYVLFSLCIILMLGDWTPLLWLLALAAVYVLWRRWPWTPWF